MKICKKCGAVQDDSRTSCLDCGAILGKPVSEAEESRVEDELYDTIDTMGDRTAPYYVSTLDKIFALIGIAAVITIFILLAFTNAHKEDLRSRLPEEYNPGEYLIIEDGNSYATAVVSGSEGSRAELDQCNRVGVCGIIGIFSLIGAAVGMLFPKFVWLMETLNLRLYVDESALSPSLLYLTWKKILKYALFAAGMAMFIATIVAYIDI